MATVVFDKLKIGEMYSRNFLTELWGYQGRQAISRGVVTPAESDVIVFFVTKEKQKTATQYEDYISNDFLYWEGEKEGVNNKRIIEASKNGDSIHLFYRYIHRSDFEYKGTLQLVSFIEMENAPFKFVFRISNDDYETQNEFQEPPISYGDKDTTKQTLALSRIGQGKFRIDLLNMWGACSLTNVQVPEILRASHIKPWKHSTNYERLDPNNGLILTPTLDTLFDRGFISFENNGKILISSNIAIYSKILNISPDMTLLKHFDGNNNYLEYHRDEIFLDKFRIV